MQCADRQCVESPDETLRKISPLVQHAAASGAEMICFPEQFPTGWNPDSLLSAEGMNGHIVLALCEMAKKYHIGILGSFRRKEVDEDSLPKNSAIAIGKEGNILARYDKIHLFRPGGEDRGFSPGSNLGIFKLGPLTCGIAICYDLRFPELFRIYAQQGVQVIFVPAAWPERRINHWELFITARACENQMFVSGINTTGKTPVDTYTGSSMTADPNGSIICKANVAEQLLFCDIDPDLVESARSSFPVAKDCRDALYNRLSPRDTR
jgi:predicted amidohydrolase